MDIISKPISLVPKHLWKHEALFSGGSSCCISIAETETGCFTGLAPCCFAKLLSCTDQGHLALADLVAKLQCWLSALYLVNNSVFQFNFPDLFTP